MLKNNTPKLIRVLINDYEGKGTLAMSRTIHKLRNTVGPWIRPVHNKLVNKGLGIEALRSKPKK